MRTTSNLSKLRTYRNFGDWNELTNLCELLGYQLTPRDVSDSIDHSELGFC